MIDLLASFPKDVFGLVATKSSKFCILFSKKISRLSLSCNSSFEFEAVRILILFTIPVALLFIDLGDLGFSK